MTDYTQATNFTAKDNLTTGDANKRIMGSTVDAELALISAAIASKANTSGVVAVTGGTFTGNVTVAKASGSTTLAVDAADDAVLVLDKAASGDGGYILGKTGGSNRWIIQISDVAAEAGSNAGSDFSIASYNDAGTDGQQLLTLTRSNGAATFSGPVVANSGLTYRVTGPCNAIIATAKGDNAGLYYGVAGYSDPAHTRGGGVIGFAPNGTTYGVVGGTDTADATYSFFGNGNGYLGGTWTEASDCKLKTDLQRIDGALDKVASLTGYTFNRIDLPGRHTGLIAQDVQAVLPEAVSEHDGTLGIAYGNLAGLLVEAIKELRAEIELIKGRL